MTASVNNNALRRANIPPSGSRLNALNLALEEIMLSSVAAVNGTSPVSDSAASATASEVHSASSAIESASEASAALSSVPAASAIASSPVSDAAGSAASAPSAASIASANASQKVASVPSVVAPTQSASPRSASPSEGANSIPRNAAVSSIPSSAASSASSPPSSPFASAAKSATLETKDISSGSTSPLASTSVSSGTTAPESTSSSEASTTAAPVTSKASSASSIAVSTQRAHTSTVRAPSSSGTGGQVSTATSPSSVPVDQTQSSSATATLRSSQPSAAAPSSPDGTANPGISFIGDTSSTSGVHADSTLSSLKAVTITSGSSTFTTTPAFITSISVESGKNGSPPQTFTSIFANPTTAPLSSGLSDWTFWDNKGAVAGVFIAVALVILSSIFGIFYCYRRRRQRLERGIIANANFHRFSGPPEMLQQQTTYQPARGLAPPSYRDDSHLYLMAPSITSGISNGHEDPTTMQHSMSQVSQHSSDIHNAGALGLTGVIAGLSNEMQDRGLFSDYHRYISSGDTRLSTPPGDPGAIAMNNDLSRETKPKHDVIPAAEPRAPSPAPSTPSIYPPSLPVVPEKDEDDYLFYERETKRRADSQVPAAPARAVANDSNPQNPFASPLDSVADAAPKPIVPLTHILTSQAYRPLTPPDSSSGSLPRTPQISGAEESIKPLNVNPFSNAFLGRSVSMRTEPIPRPPRSPLRLPASGSSLQNKLA